MESNGTERDTLLPSLVDIDPEIILQSDPDVHVIIIRER